MPGKESATILVVDDDPFILKLVGEQIAACGLRPLLAATGKEALRCAESQGGIDLLLTDIVMPEMNGFDLAKRIADLYPETRILFMSGHNPHSIAEQMIPVREYGFMQKPFGLDTLITTIQNTLARPPVPPLDLFAP